MATYLILPANSGLCSEITIEADDFVVEEDFGIINFRRNWSVVGLVSIKNIVCVIEMDEPEDPDEEPGF